MTVWRVAIDANGENAHYNELKNREVVAIGWCDLGDLTGLRRRPRDEIERYTRSMGDKVYTKTITASNDWWWGCAGYLGHREHIGRIFHYFLSCIKPGDLIIGFQGFSPVGIVEICTSSSYIYDPTYEYAHCWFRVKWVDASSVGITWDGTRFLGISQYPSREKQTVNLWQNYKMNNNFNPCDFE